MAEEAEELDRVARRGGIETKPACGAAGQILEMTFAGETHQAVGENPSLGHRPGIGHHRVIPGCPSVLSR